MALETQFVTTTLIIAVVVSVICISALLLVIIRISNSILSRKIAAIAKNQERLERMLARPKGRSHLHEGDYLEKWENKF